MKSLQVLLLSTSVMLGAERPLQAQGQPPESYSVCFHMHATPSEPSTAVVFSVSMQLTLVDVMGSRIGWEVSRVTFHQPAGSGHGARTWMVAAPALDTPDGLWWTTHGDIDQPALDEFDVPPQMSGEADAASSGYGDLEFTLKGVAISPGSPPYPTTAYLDYEFLMIGEGPVGEGNDEPVEGDDCGE